MSFNNLHMRRIASLDGLRAISIALVVLSHVYKQIGSPDDLISRRTAWQFGHFGVQVFFVISGFLITLLLMEERDRTGKTDLRQFYFRRSLRIFPAAFAYIAIVTVIFHPSQKSVLQAATYTMCYAGYDRPWIFVQLWSLSVEEQFYLLWPLLFAFRPQWARNAVWTVMAVAPMLRLGSFWLRFEGAEYYFPNVADSIAAGCLLALYYPVLKKRLPAMTKSVPAVLIAGATVALVPVFAAHAIAWILLGGLLPLLIAMCVFIAVERRDAMLNSKPLCWIGVLSYSLYLWQQPFVGPHRPAQGMQVVLLLGAALLAATASYYLIERPFLLLRKRRESKVVAKGAVSPPIPASAEGFVSVR